MSKEYNGHPSWAAWNVALWIGNDEGLYHHALDCIKRSRTISRAAALMAVELDSCGIRSTPDGARYSLRSLRLALAGLKGDKQ